MNLTKRVLLALSLAISGCCYTDVQGCLNQAEDFKAQCVRQCLYDADDPAICDTIQPSCGEQAEDLLDKCLETETVCYEGEGWW